MNGEYSIESVEAATVYPLLLYAHYARRIPSISHAFALYRDERIVGCCTFGTPPARGVLACCGEEMAKHVLEFNRLALLADDNVPNLASWFSAECMRRLPKPKIIVSYADTKWAHVGVVYQSLNFLYTGTSIPFMDKKLVGHEHKHGASFTKEQLARYAEFVTYKARSTKHRYVRFLGSRSWRKRAEKALRWETLPYPKADKTIYPTPSFVATQMRFRFEDC